MRPITLPFWSANQGLPSGPVVAGNGRDPCRIDLHVGQLHLNAIVMVSAAKCVGEDRARWSTDCAQAILWLRLIHANHNHVRLALSEVEC